LHLVGQMARRKGRRAFWRRDDDRECGVPTAQGLIDQMTMRGVQTNETNCRSACGGTRDESLRGKGYSVEMERRKSEGDAGKAGGWSGAENESSCSQVFGMSLERNKQTRCLKFCQMVKVAMSTWKAEGDEGVEREKEKDEDEDDGVLAKGSLGKRLLSSAGLLLSPQTTLSPPCA
jgi:hypothetical protein